MRDAPSRARVEGGNRRRRRTEASVDGYVNGGALVHDRAVIYAADITAGIPAINDGAVAGGHYANVSDGKRGDDDGSWGDGDRAAGDGDSVGAGDGHAAAGDGDGAVVTDDGGPARTGHAIGGPGFGCGVGEQEQGDRDECGGEERDGFHEVIIHFSGSSGRWRPPFGWSSTSQFSRSFWAE